ncbi:MAG: hypothetical protein VX248_17515 [Pseudomonadota bacterium]|nr:hypothetical protein [Pseudomonadota bacterium]
MTSKADEFRKKASELERQARLMREEHSRQKPDGNDDSEMGAFILGVLFWLGVGVYFFS